MDFNKDALGYLIAFARAKAGKPVSAEDVTLAAEADGVAPADKRAWGSVFSQASKDKLIVRTSYIYPRSMGNGSLGIGWTAA